LPVASVVAGVAPAPVSRLTSASIASGVTWSGRRQSSVANTSQFRQWLCHSLLMTWQL